MADVAATEPITKSSSTIMRKEVYGDLKKGERVFLDGERYGRFKSVSFEFLCHARNESTGKEWLELWGGRRGYEMVTAVDPSCVLRSSR